MSKSSMSLAERLPAGMTALRRAVLRPKGGGLLAVMAVAAAVTAVALALGATTPFRFVESLTYDLRMALAAPPAGAPLVIVKIDDAAMTQMRQRSACHCLAPLDKAWLAELIAVLDAKGARAIGVDYLLDTWSSKAEFDTFAARTAHLRAPLVAVVDSNMTPGTDYPVAPGVHYADARALVRDDYDDVIRRYDPKPGRLRAMAAELALALGRTPPARPFILRYRRPDPQASAENAGAIAPSVSAAYAAALPADFFRDKIVLIGRVTRSAGADADALKEDMHATPLRFLPGHYDGTPGVEIHAHALSQILAGDRVREPGRGWVLLILFLYAVGGAVLGRTTTRWWLAVVIVLGALLAHSLAAFGALEIWGRIVPMTSPLLSFAFAFFVLSRLAAVELRNQRAFYSSTLEHYLAPQVIDRIVEGNEPVRISADQRDITVLVTDLEDFSALVSGMELALFSTIINGYFDGVIEILWKHEAMIDKMTGDGLMALFGAPIERPDHADRALACAREIDVFAQGYCHAVHEAHGVAFGRTRMGLDSGVALVGNFGGERRFNYTAYGQVVVIAARLETANKDFGSRILFSAQTLARATAVDGVRPMGQLQLRGVDEPVTAYSFEEAAGD